MPEDFQQFCERMWQAQTPPPAARAIPAARPECVPPPPPPGLPAFHAPVAMDYLALVKELRAMNTPRFEGSQIPEVAEDWLVRITHDFDYLRCPLQYRAEIASHHLFGQARHWWDGVEHRLVEFINLQQSDRSVGDYEAEFTRLLRYGANLVPTERLKIQKFIAGLRPSLRRKIEVLEYPTFSRYICQFEKMERGEREEQEEARIRDRTPAKRFFLSRPSTSTDQTSQSQDKGKTSAVQPPPPQSTQRRPCPRCRRVHFGPCSTPPTCFQCGRPGHIATYCPEKGTTLTNARPLRIQPLQQSGIAPRVYVLAAEADTQGEAYYVEEPITDDVVAEEDAEQPDVAAITGILYIHDISCHTLFDTGATHNFLSVEKADELALTDIDTTSRYQIHTPGGEILPMRGVLHDVSLQICGRDLPADLIIVPIQGYDLILGMD
ncbi:PREDICTED: uncharacterized protein LOC104806023 [Tarenaya hassleriana]|uniref:uncharacterized protein LOC104806023 n=1 Tax=Tarenaya hassleriana TaxID=28532 RepID=UPI00053C61D9|nr:PREDICTED: uncharacterized protein LOC104806023 [Tarenaya hassleriana]